MGKLKMTTQQWVERAIKVHSNVYDYSKCKYKSSREKVIIICPIHGEFQQVANNHLNGCGCGKNGHDFGKHNNIKLKQEELILKAKKVHGDRYDYSLVKYVDNKTKVKIICPEHGVFEQLLRENTKYGCNKCYFDSMNIKFNGFLDRAKEKHGNKYNYSLADFKGMGFEIKIICNIHGLFEQKPSIHLSGHGCKKCGTRIMVSKTKECYKNKRKDFSHIIPPEGSRIIPLTQGKYAIIDEEDYERVNQYMWQATTNDGTYYAKGVINNNFTLMHRFIMGLEKGDKRIIDHIFHDTLDNRKSKLRICTFTENGMNRKSNKNSKSKYKGVFWDKNISKWKSGLRLKGINYFLGYFENEEDAARAYDAKAKEVHGQFIYLNFPIK